MMTFLFTVIFSPFNRVRHIIGPLKIFVEYMNISKHLEIWAFLKSENGLDKSCSC